MKNFLRFNTAFVFILLLVPSVTSPATSCAGDKVVIQVLAGAGLMDALNDVKELYGKKSGFEVRYSFAAAGILRKQIEEGGHADLLLHTRPGYGH
jgi:ABC-type molybdate transport system substrate-binding protein